MNELQELNTLMEGIYMGVRVIAHLQYSSTQGYGVAIHKAGTYIVNSYGSYNNNSWQCNSQDILKEGTFVSTGFIMRLK